MSSSLEPQASTAGPSSTHKLDKMIRNPVEMAVVQAKGTKVFTLTNSHLGAEGGGLVFGRW